MRYVVPDAQAMAGLAAKVGKMFRPGDTVLLSGELGAGKTTFVRGYLASLGHEGPVRSPTFNLIQVFDTVPPVVHADLYRVASAEGLGLEDYAASHVTFVEWPDRLQGAVDEARCWIVTMTVSPEGRTVDVRRPRRGAGQKKSPDILSGL